MPPVVAPVKKIPSVRDVMQDPEETKTTAENQFPSFQGGVAVGRGGETTITKTEGETENQFSTVQEGTVEGQGGEETKTKTEEEVPEGRGGEENEPAAGQGGEETEPVAGRGGEETKTDGETEPAPADDKFVEAWRAMFDLVFGKISTVYYPLKETLPQRKGNIIEINVKNELVKNSFEEHTRLALQYLRNNYDPQIDNIEVRVVNVEEKQKFVYGTQEQMNDLYAENADLPEFLKILNLSAKDI